MRGTENSEIGFDTRGGTKGDCEVQTISNPDDASGTGH